MGRVKSKKLYKLINFIKTILDRLTNLSFRKINIFPLWFSQLIDLYLG